MTCRAVESRLSAYLDGELTGAEMIEIRRHIDGCSTCASEAQAIRRIKMLVVAQQELEPESGFEGRLIARVFRSQPRTRRAAWASAISLTAIVVAAGVLAFFVSTWISPPPRPTASGTDAGSLDLAHDQMYFNATDPLSGPAPVVSASYDQR